MSRQFSLLGSLEVVADGKPSELLNSPKGSALVTYLIVTGQTHSREFLADLFWEATSTAQALRNLRGLLVRIRDLVPEFQITRTTVAFQPFPDTQVDFLALQTILQQKTEQIEIAQLDAALQLYRGDLLANFYLDDAPRFEEWLVLERERLRQQVRAAYNWACKTYLAQEQWANGANLAERWLKLDPLDEDALRAVMHCLASSGDPGKGLLRYEKFRQLLWDEMAVEPESATRSLGVRLEALQKEQGEQITWDHITTTNFPEPGELVDPGPLPTQSVIPHPRNHDFTGRKESLLHLASMLMPTWKADDHRATVITGMGGIGKTQLAVEFCYRYGRFFPGGVYLISFAEGDQVAEEVAQIGGERGMGLYKEADNLRQADQVGRVIKAWQEPIPRLLIFDSCEDEALLSRWLPVTGGCSVLLTSRRAQWTPELRVAEWPLPILDADESVSFLKNLVSDLTTEDATRIAEELGHLPLALHLAGSFLRKYRGVSAEQYLAQLHDKTLLTHPSLQGRGTHFSPTGHELDIARTFAVNWGQLDSGDPTDAYALQLITHAVQFALGVPLPRELLFDTLQVVQDDWMEILLAEDGLARLVSLGLIRMDGVATLWLHRLIGAFVKMQIEDVLEAQTAVALTIWKRLQTQWETETVLDQMPIASTHVQFAMEVEVAKGTQYGVHLAHAFGRHLLDIGDFARARIYMEKALNLGKQVYGADQAETADILMDLGTLTWKADSDQAAWIYYQQAFAIYEQCFGLVHPKTANSLTTLAILYARTGDYDGAIEHYQRALRIYEQVLPSEHPTVALNLYNLAVAYRRAGDYEQALSHYTETLHIQRQLWPDDNPRVLTTVSSIGLVNFLRGNYEVALEYFQNTLAGRLARLGRHNPHTSLSMSHVGITLGLLGRHEEAIASLQDSLSIREQIFGEDHPQLVYALSYLGFMYQIVGNLEAARQVLEHAWSIQEMRQLENEQTAQTITGLASVLLQLGEMEMAKYYLDHALTIWEQKPTIKNIQKAFTLIGLGEWWEAGGDNEIAQLHYEQALTILQGRVVDTHWDWQRVHAHLTRLQGNLKK